MPESGAGSTVQGAGTGRKEAAAGAPGRVPGRPAGNGPARPSRSGGEHDAEVAQTVERDAGTVAGGATEGPVRSGSGAEDACTSPGEHHPGGGASGAAEERSPAAGDGERATSDAKDEAVHDLDGAIEVLVSSPNSPLRPPPDQPFEAAAEAATAAMSDPFDIDDDDFDVEDLFTGDGGDLSEDFLEEDISGDGDPENQADIEEAFGWAIGSELEFIDEPASAAWDGPTGDGLDEEEGRGGFSIRPAVSRDSSEKEPPE